MNFLRMTISNSVTGVGSEDERTVESFRCENDQLRDAINSVDKQHLETETRAKTLMNEISGLKEKIKLLMETKLIDVSTIVSTEELAAIKTHLSEGSGRHKTAKQVQEHKPPKETQHKPNNSRNKVPQSVPIVETDDGHVVRDALRNAKTTTEVELVIIRAKRMGLSHEIVLAEKLLISMNEQANIES